MKRALIAAASSLLVFCWMGSAQAQPSPAAPERGRNQQQLSTQTYDVRGSDPRYGAYTGELTLEERHDGRLNARGTVKFSDGTEQQRTGVLWRRGNSWRGVLRTAPGAAGRLAGRRADAVVIVLQINPAAKTLAGQVLGSRGLSKFQGQVPVTQPDQPDQPDPIDPHDPSDFSGDTFAGKPVVDYDPAVGIKDPKNVAYRVKVDWQNDDKFDELLDKLLADPKLSQAETLAIGYTGDSSLSAAAAKLVANKDKLKSLKNLFFGDIDYDEAEISWIEQTDVGPLLAAVPSLELLKIKGGTDLGLSGAGTHENLKKLVIETGGMDGSVLREVGAWTFPNMEHLELWTGSDEYGWDGSVGDAAKIISGENLPKLKFLGLMNSMIADDFAKAMVASPLIKRIETLDLSMGTLGDEGARALLGSADAKAINVNLDHHYISDAVADRFAAEGFTKLTLGEQVLDPDYPDDRYVSVGE